MEQATTTSTCTTKYTPFDDPLNLSSLDVDTSDLEASLNFLLDSPKGKNKRKYINDDDDEEAPGTIDFSLTIDSSASQCSSNQYPSPTFRHCRTEIPPMMNTVHMEVQENAKIPNLYHVPVRRNNDSVHGDVGANALHKGRNSNNHQTTGSSSASTMEDDTMLVDELLRLTEEDWTLTEKFLGNDHRYVHPRKRK